MHVSETRVDRSCVRFVVVVVVVVAPLCQVCYVPSRNHKKLICIEFAKFARILLIALYICCY